MSKILKMLVLGSLIGGASLISPVIANAVDLNQDRVSLERELQTLPDKKRNRTERAALLFDLAAVEVGLGYYDRATGHLNAALLHFRQTKDKDGQGRVHAALGDIDRTFGRYPDSYQHYQQALMLTGEKVSTTRAEVLWRLGELYRYQRQEPTAAGYYSEAQDIFKALGNPDGEGQVLFSWAQLRHMVRNYDAAETGYIEAAALFEAAENMEDAGEAYLSVGKMKKGQKGLSQKRGFLVKAIAAFAKTRNLGREGAATLALGNLERTMFKDGDAEVSLMRAQVLFQQAGNAEGEGDALRALGHLARAVGDNEPALDHYQGALGLYQLAGKSEKLGGLYQNLGDLERWFGRADKARGYYTAALGVYRNQDDKLGQANIYLGLGLVESGANTNLALRYFEDSARLYDAVGMTGSSTMARQAASKLRADITQ